MLAVVALAFRRLDVQAGAGHRVPDVPQQRLDPPGAEHGVVRVVAVRRDERAVAGVPGLLVAPLVDDELQLRAGQRGPAAFRGPVDVWSNTVCVRRASATVSSIPVHAGRLLNRARR